MRKLLDKLRHNFVIRIGLIYLIIAWIVIATVIFVTSRAVIPEATLLTTAILSIGYFPIVLQVSWAIGAVPPIDRRLFFRQIVWVYGPIFLLYGPSTLLLGEIVFTEYTSPLSFTIYLLLAPLSGVWMLMSARIAREWAMKGATDPESLIRAEKKLFGGINQYEAEANVSRKMYYSFLAGFAAVFFVILESLISEFFDNTFGLGGYTGASIAALGIAAIIYPIHKRASKFVKWDANLDAESDVENAASAAKEVANASIRYLKLDVSRPYLKILFWVVFSLIVAAVNLYPYF